MRDSETNQGQVVVPSAVTDSPTLTIIQLKLLMMEDMTNVYFRRVCSEIKRCYFWFIAAFAVLWIPLILNALHINTLIDGYSP